MAVVTTERPVSEGKAPIPGDPRRLAAVVRALHDQIDPPAGWRVEIVEGSITVAASPSGKQALILLDIRKAIMPTLPRGLEILERIKLEEPETDRYEPDLGIWPRALLEAGDAWIFPGEECLLAVEVTSPRQECRDCDYAKAAGYARAGVPVYLVVDQRQRVCVVFSEPEGGRYRTRREVPFGRPVTVPLETPVTIETSEF